QRGANAAEPEGFSRALWAQAAAIGLLGLAYPEAEGGLGGSAVDVMLVMQALGRALPLEPFLPTLVLGAAALRGASAAQRARWIPPIVAGDRVLAWAHAEAPNAGRLHHVATWAWREGEHWVIDGMKPAV